MVVEELWAMSDLLMCPVCLETVEDPHVLPQCGHTFCKRCIGGDDPAAFVKVDVTANQNTARTYGVTQLPTIKLVRGGEVVDDYGGQRSANDIIDYINQQAGRPAGASATAADAGSNAGEPQIVTRNGEERVYIPINRGGDDAKPAHNDDAKPAYNDDKKPAYNDDKKPAHNF